MFAPSLIGADKGKIVISLTVIVMEKTNWQLASLFKTLVNDYSVPLIR